MKKYDFAFIIHPRDKQELLKSYPIFRFIPNFLLYFISPRIVGDIVYKDDKGKKLNGALIAIINLPFQFLKRDNKIKKRILAALKLASKIGAKIVGLGSLSSPAVSGGLDIKDQSNVSITNGNALTAAVVTDDIKQLSKIVKLHKKKVHVAILGATGSIGQGVVHSLIGNVDSMMLIARKQNKLDNLNNILKEQHPDYDISISTSVSEAKESDIIIVATSHYETVLSPEDVKSGAIIYDITQPSNLKKEDWLSRDDVFVVEGGLIRIPGLHVDSITGLDNEESFACLTETLLLVLADRTDQDFSLGYVIQENMKEIENIAKKYNVSSLLKAWDKDTSWGEIKRFIKNYA